MASKRSTVTTSPEKKESAQLPTNKEFKRSALMENLGWFHETLCYNLPPGEPWLPLHVLVNINKGTMMIYIFILMCYFENFSLGAWVYLGLHGNYGLMWYLKDRTFPDAGFCRHATTVSALVPFPLLLIPYYFIAYWMISGTHNRDPSPERIFVAIQMYCTGVVFMVLTDAQKYLVLRERKGLITHCMTGWSRNMNYLGEMLLYGSFGVLCQCTEAWLIYAYVWGGIFVLRMSLKDYSLSMKPDWPEYKAKTWFYLPKLYNSGAISVFLYTVFFGGAYWTFTHGGIEATAKSLYI